jgi:hypothetical protein
MTAREQALRLGGGAKPYALQAAIAACHMRARTAEETDWTASFFSTTPCCKSIHLQSWHSISQSPLAWSKASGAPCHRGAALLNVSQSHTWVLATHRHHSGY